jgi:hypothetical protein
MILRDLGENFKVVLSTKKTLFGAIPSEFIVTYAEINSLGVKTVVAGGATEAVETIAGGSEHTATTTASAGYGSKKLYVDSNTSDLAEGDVIEYATGLYAYIQRIVADKVYLKTGIKTAVASGVVLTQVGNTGQYTTADVAIPTEGEYIVAIEGSDYGVLVEQRVKITDSTVTTTVDTDAPDETIAVAY